MQNGENASQQPQSPGSLESREQAEIHRKQRGDPEPEVRPAAFGKHHDIGGVGDFAGMAMFC